MKIELKKIKVSESLSEETTAFTADVFVDGTCIGYAKNGGYGGETELCFNRSADSPLRKLADQAHEWAKAQPPVNYGLMNIPMTLDLYVDIIIENHLRAKEEAKVKKAQLKEIQWGVPNSGRYTTTHWKKVTLAQVAAHPNGITILQSRIDTIKRDLKSGETILNAEYLRTLGCKV